MNMAIYYHELPAVDDMLYVSATSTEINVSDIVKGWVGSKLDFFLVIGVDDEEVKEFYKKVKTRSHEIVTAVKEYAEKNFPTHYADCCLKFLFRFETAKSAWRFMEYLDFFLEEECEDTEEFDDYIYDCCLVADHGYGEPWKFVPAITEDDWKPGSAFYKEIHDFAPRGKFYNDGATIEEEV